MKRKMWVTTKIILASLMVSVLLVVLWNAIKRSESVMSNQDSKAAFEQVYQVSSDTFKHMNMHFTDENIKLYTTEDTDVRIVQATNYRIREEDRLEIEEVSDTINIQKVKRYLLYWPGTFKRKETISVYIPRNILESISVYTVSGSVVMDELEVDVLKFESTSGDIEGTAIQTHTLELKTVSGAIWMQNTTADTSRVNTVSGKVEVEGKLYGTQIDTVSGGIAITNQISVATSSINTVSGNVALKMPDVEDIDLAFQSLGGEIQGSFIEEAVGRAYVYTKGSGKNKIQIKTVSGNARITLF